MNTTELLALKESISSLKKIKDLNNVCKQLGLSKFKKTEKPLAKETILNDINEKLQNSNNDESDLSDEEQEEQEETVKYDAELVLSEYDNFSDENVEEEEPNKVESLTEEPLKVEEPLSPTNPEEKDYDEIYKSLQTLLNELKTRENELLKQKSSVEKMNVCMEEKNKILTDEFNNLFNKYENTVAENETLKKSNEKLKNAVQNLMSNL
jgi:chromosome segregation ATPase